MKSLLLLLSVFSIFLFSCNKDSSHTPAPEASFSVGEYGGMNVNYTDTAFIIGTHDALVLRSTSKNSDSVIWNFGNGKISNELNTVLSYDMGGQYRVTLTAYGKHGQKSTSSIPVTVKDRFLKSFSINNLDINKFSPSQNGLPVFSKVDIWLEIKLSRSSTDVYSDNGDILAPVVYKSPVFPDISSDFRSSINYIIPVSEKISVDCPVNNLNFFSGGRGLIINLYGKDPSGTYLLSSSAWSGTGISVSNGGNPAKVKNYDLNTPVAGSPTSVALHCEFN